MIFFAVLVPLTIVIETRLILAGDSIRNHVGLVIALMWSPALASFVARIVMREGVRDVSFRFGGKTGLRMIAYAVAFPLLVGFLAYGLAWSTGLAEFSTPEVPGLPNITTPWLAFLCLIAIRATIGVVIAAITAAGEEIGWRGYLTTRLIEARVPFPILVSGVIWWAWHAAMIAAGVYASGPNTWLSAALFLPVIIALNFFMARLRLQSGSVWPAVVAHAAWNSIIQGVFDFSTADETSAHWVGEAGILVAVVSLVVAAAVVYKPAPMLSAPGQRLDRSVHLSEL